MIELSLFTGAGGGVLATQHLLGWQTVGYVEIDEYCQKIIQARIDDGYLADAPIFSDIKTFVEAGYADVYKGMVDVITAGFPCQPFSVAGKHQGEDDPRNLWPETMECIRRIRPRYAFLENVPGLLYHQYFGRILGDLAESGFDARWRVLSAVELGAPHKRDRLWIVAYATELCEGQGREQPTGTDAVGYQGARDVRAESPNASNPNCDELRQPPECELRGGSKAEPRDDGEAESVAYAERQRCEGGDHVDAERQKQSVSEQARGEQCSDVGGGWWQAEPGVGRVADGVANRVDRLKALGNGQVPAVAAKAWELL